MIKESAGTADSKLLYHLNQLKRAEPIEGEQQGSWASYRLTPLGQRCATAGYLPLE